MTTELDQEVSAFEFKVDPIRIVDQIGANIEILASGMISNISSETFINLCSHSELRVGLLVYETDSQSSVVGEFRSVNVSKGSTAGAFRAKFIIPRSLFAAQQCRLAKIDMLYENKFWFEQKLGPRPFIPVWVEKEAKEIDIFEYYQLKYMPK